MSTHSLDKLSYEKKYEMGWMYSVKTANWAEELRAHESKVHNKIESLLLMRYWLFMQSY